MSADVSVHWRSLNGCGGNIEPHPRSPAISALPPLPDLIPIRKGGATQQKNVENCQSSDYSTSVTDCSPTVTNTGSIEEFNTSVADSESCSKSEETENPWPQVDGNDVVVGCSAGNSPSRSFSSVHGGESVRCDNIDSGSVHDNNNDVFNDDDNKPSETTIRAYETEHSDNCADSYAPIQHPTTTATPIPCQTPTGELCQIDNLIVSRDCMYNKQQLEEEKPTSVVVAAELPARRTSTRPKRVPISRRMNIKRNPQAKRRKKKTVQRSKTTPASKKGNYKGQCARKSTYKAGDQVTTVPRVNPIFLFIKQDDTRIVEVRCEDYDKRNRIRLTKTANGWRATPRTDSATVKIASLLPKVVVTKRERDDADDAGAAAVRHMASTDSKCPEPTITLENNWRLNPFAAAAALASQTKQEKVDTTYGNERHSSSHKKKKKKKKKHRKEHKELTSLRLVVTKRELEFVDTNTFDESCSTNTLKLAATVDDGGVSHFTTQLSHLHHEAIAPTSMMADASLDNSLAAELIHNKGHHDDNDDDDDNNTAAPMAVGEEKREDDEEEHRNCMLQKTLSPLHFSSAENSVKEDEMHCVEKDGTANRIDDGDDDNDEPIEEKPLLHQEIDIAAIRNGTDDEHDKLDILGPDSSAPAVVVYEPYDAKSVCSSVEELNSEEVNNISAENPFNITADNVTDHQQQHHHHHISNHHHLHHQHHHQLGEYHDLIEGIPHIQGAHSDDILDNCDNTMTGAELLDSLVERGCEDNHISGEEDVKHTICLSDDYNDDDDILLESQPVVDIISRLGDSLGSPKCLSFNEAGEIEGMHESLFDGNASDDLHHSDELNDSLTPFNRSALEELSMTLKDLEKRNDDRHEKQPVDSTIVSPDSQCQEELPKDLSFKKNNEAVQNIRHHSSPRPISRDSDAIQSPQPSGLPAVPPSPDILLHQPHKHLNKSLFLDLSSPSPNASSEPRTTGSEKNMFMDLTSPPVPLKPNTQQKEPLDLGKHRKSASPTVSCSEEAKRMQVTPDLDTPLPKRIKSEHTDKSNAHDLLRNSKTSQLVELLASGKDPDPLTQLRLLISNPEWKLPDPILVPKDRLNAVLASPAREIPLLLTTRPELRLPEAFAFPSILQDPDILVISFAQLESILQKQHDLLKTTTTKPANGRAERSEKKHVAEKPYDSPRAREKAQPKTPVAAAPVLPMAGLLGNGLGGDIDAATMAAINQMLWLPYLGQMGQLGQLNPEMIKAMSGLSSGGMSDVMQFANQNRFPSFQPHQAAPALNYNNPLEYAMWQEALAQANTANLQRVMKMNSERESQKKQPTEGKQHGQPQSQQTRQMQQASSNAYLQQHQQQQQQLQQQQQHLLQQQQQQQQLQQLQQQQQQHQQHNQKVGHMLSPMSQLASSFFPTNISPISPTNSRHYNNMQRNQQHQHQQYLQQQQQQLQQQQMSASMAQYSPTYRQQLANNSEHQHSSSSTTGNRANSLFLQPPASKQQQQNHPQNHSSAIPNPFFPTAALHQDFGSIGGSTGAGNSRTSKSRKELLQQQQFQQHHQQLQQLQLQQQQQQHQLHGDTKPRVTCKSLMNLLQPDLVQDQFKHSSSPETNSKLSNLMAMPSFDLTSPPVSTTSTTPTSHHQQQPKLKVKPGQHLLDPMAMQRRLLNAEEVPEVGSTTSGLDEMMMPNAGLYHPLLK